MMPAELGLIEAEEGCGVYLISEEALALARRIIKYEEESIERLKEFL